MTRREEEHERRKLETRKEDFIPLPCLEIENYEVNHRPATIG